MGRKKKKKEPGALSKLGQWIAYVAVRATLAALSAIPFGAARAIALAGARAFFVLDRHHRDIALVNLRLAFPEQDEAWRRRVARGSFENFGLIVAELAHLRSLTAENLAQHVTWDEEHYALYEKAKLRGKGCFYVTGHFGNWEILAHAHALAGRPFHAVVRPLDNPLLDEFLERLRVSTGNRIIDKKRGGRQAMVAALRRNEDVGILVDQYSRRIHGVYAPFFGVEASTTKGLAIMALRTGAALFPVVLAREPGDLRFHVIILPEIDVEKTGDPKEDVRRITAKVNEAMETVIRMYPDHWLWGHRRWKNSPDIEGNIYEGGRLLRRAGGPERSEGRQESM